jgi:ADP-ribosylglycohydrolase
MIGTIIGDIIGSRFERNPTKNKKFKLFTPECNYTDDSVMSMATLESITKNVPYSTSYQKWGSEYPNRGYGSAFKEWITQTIPQPYNSWGNGSAMRVSPIGYIYNTEKDVLKQAKLSAECSHNHPEAIKGAQATALAIFMARNNKTKEEIQKRIELLFGYDFSIPISKYKMKYEFDVTCQGSVPQSIQCFLESKNYEDCIRTAIAMGGDSDTMAAISGGIASAYYGEIPAYMMKQAFKVLPDRIWHLIMYYAKKYNWKAELNYLRNK